MLNLLRLLAWLIDTIICGAVTYTAINLFQVICAPYNLGYYVNYTIIGFIGRILLFVLLPLVYFVWMESAKFQGTLGKILCQLEVRNLTGQKASLIRLLIRFGVKALYFWIPFGVVLGLVIRYAQTFWDLLVIGPLSVVGMGLCCLVIYMASFFTPQKQTLHDLIAGTVVVRKVNEIPPETVASVPLSPDP